MPPNLKKTFKNNKPNCHFKILWPVSDPLPQSTQNLQPKLNKTIMPTMKKLSNCKSFKVRSTKASIAKKL